MRAASRWRQPPAQGGSGEDGRLATPADHVHRLGGLHHVDLLSQPRCTPQAQYRLLDRPEGARPARTGYVTAGSRGSPSTRSPTIVRWIWVVPPAIELDGASSRP